MIKLKFTGLDKLQKKLDEMKKPEFVESKLTEVICDKVPDAKNEKHNFKFIHTPEGKIQLDPKSVTPELYERITKAFKQ